jgi:hypothetical protein
MADFSLSSICLHGKTFGDTRVNVLYYFSAIRFGDTFAELALREFVSAVYFYHGMRRYKNYAARYLFGMFFRNVRTILSSLGAFVFRCTHLSSHDGTLAILFGRRCMLHDCRDTIWCANNCENSTPASFVWRRRGDRIRHTQASRASSTKRRTSSATVTPSSAARFDSHASCGAVKAIDLRRVLMGAVIAPHAGAVN